ENMLKENEERIVQSVKKTLQAWVVEDASVMINDMLEGKNNDGLFQDVNVMSPAGAPEDQIVVPFQWGIKLKNYDFVGDNLHLRLDGYFKDEFKGESILPIEYMANTPPRVNRVSNNN